MVKRFIKADITTPQGAPRINYPEGWYENAAKIIVRVYDDENKKCLAEFDDEELFQQLIETGKVEELTEAEMEAEVARLRPPRPEVMVTLTGKGKKKRADIEKLLKAKGLKYRIEDR